MLRTCYRSALCASVSLGVLHVHALADDSVIEVRRLGVPNAQTETPARSEARPFEMPGRRDSFDWAALQRVWDHAGNQNWTDARRGLNMLKSDFPSWTAPDDLERAIRSGLANQRLTTALEDERWGDVLGLVPAHTVSCADDLRQWARSEALAQLDQQASLLDFYTAQFSTCALAKTRQRLINLAADQLDLNGLEGMQQLKAAASTLDWSRIDASFQREQRNEAARNEDWVRLASLARAHTDRDALIQAAWGLMGVDLDAAQSAFEDALALEVGPNAAYGRALAAYQQGDVSLAAALKVPDLGEAFYQERRELIGLAKLQLAGDAIAAKQFSKANGLINEAAALSEEARRPASALKRSLALASSDEAYALGQYERAISLATPALSSVETGEAARSRIAWARLELGDNKAAARAFWSLYEANPTTEYADGLVIASSRLGWLPRLGDIAKDASEPLYGRVAEAEARTALYRKDYLTALDLDAETASALRGVDKPYVRQSISMRANDLDAGEGQTVGVVSRSSLVFSSAKTHIETGVIGFGLDAGVGSDPNRSDDGNGFVPFVQFEREGPIELRGRLATTPSGGPVDATPVGGLGASFDAAGASVDIAIHRSSVQETVTSLFGREDQSTGESWGRVVETAAAVSARQTFSGDWSAQGEAKLGQRSGERVEDNTLVLIGISAVKSFDVDGHDYLSAGPFYQFQAFDQNTNFHSAEHGGYFSPQSYHRIGAGLFGQTEDVRPWMLRYQGGLALEVSETDGAPLRPLTDPTGDQLTGASNSGLAGSLEAEYARKLNDRWTVSAAASAIVSEAFNEARFGIALKYVPGGQANVTTRDFWPDPFSRDLP